MGFFGAHSIDSNLFSWESSVRALLRGVHLEGVEGLPQPLGLRFAEQWAKYCGCRFGLLMGHGTDALRIALAAVLDHEGHRLKMFERQQAIRARNFRRLRELFSDLTSLIPLTVHSKASSHGMYMFAMRYRSERCGDVELQDYLKFVQAEGAPVYRAFATTISQQPAIRNLMDKRPDYLRVLCTPVSEQAARDTLYIPHEVFLGSSKDMEDIAAALRKVERRLAARKKGS